MAESVSHLCIWIIGLCAAIYFLQKFESELKPLVLAFIFVSILEGVVQFFEWTLQKTWRLLLLLIWKFWQVVGLCIIRIFRCEFEVKDMGKDILYNWGDLRQKWQGGDAGRNSLFRMTAVGVTLFLVGFLTLVAKGLIQNEVSSVIDKFGLYKSQITSMVTFVVQFVNALLPQVPELVPRQYRNQTMVLIKQAGTMISKDMDSIPAEAEAWGVWLLNQILSQTSSSIMDFVFFMLYSAFMLFDPLHINFEAAVGHDSMGGIESAASDRLQDGWMVMTSRSVYQKLKRDVSSRMARRAASWAARHGGQPLLEEDERSGVLDTGDDDVEASRLPRSSVREEPDENGGSPEQFRLTEVQYYIYRIVWQYFLLTMLLNAIFASAVFLLLQSLAIDLAVVLAACTFLLSFIPELGAIIATCLPIPFILLTPTHLCKVQRNLQDNHDTYYDGVDVNCISDFPRRLQLIFLSIVGILLIKLLVSNLLAAFLMGRNRTLAGAVGDSATEEVRETHGVLVLFAVVFFGRVWGITGMLISVPVISVARLTINMGWEKTSARAIQSIAAYRRSLSRSYTRRSFSRSHST